MTYVWKAIYNDNTELNQYKDGKEVLFKEINQDKLIAFRLDNELGRHIIVDLKIGMFVVNGSIFSIPNISGRKENYRLIYFRRVARNITMHGAVEQDVITEPYIGFQVTIDGKNHKAMVSIKENDLIYNWHIE
jgi:hypothetical protein